MTIKMYSKYSNCEVASLAASWLGVSSMLHYYTASDQGHLNHQHYYTASDQGHLNHQFLSLHLDRLVPYS